MAEMGKTNRNYHKEWLAFLSEVDTLDIDFEAKSKESEDDFFAVEINSKTYGDGWWVCDFAGPVDGPYSRSDAEVTARRESER